MKGAEHLRDDVIEFFQRAAHCKRWEDQTETAAAFVATLDRYIDARISEALNRVDCTGDAPEHQNQVKSGEA